jgi:hypothetical protein
VPKSVRVRKPKPKKRRKIKRPKGKRSAQPRDRAVPFAEIWDSPLEEIKARLEGRVVSFVWKSSLTDQVGSSTFVIAAVRDFDPATGLLRFWEKDGRATGNFHAFRVGDLADIR